MNDTTEGVIAEPFTLGDIPPDVLYVSGAMTLLMIGYWYVRYRQGGALTLDLFFYFLYLYVPIVFTTIFAFSPLNRMSTGDDWYWRYLPYLREAYYVSLFGAAVFSISAVVASRWDSAPPGYRFLYRSIHDFWGTAPGLALLVALILALGAVTIATAGYGNAREHFMTQTELRPAAHLFSSIAVIGIYIALIEGYCRRSWKFTAVAMLLVMLMVGYGSRKVIVGTLLYYSAVRLVNARSRRIVLAMCCSLAAVFFLIFIGLAMEAIRNKELSAARLAAAPSYLLFGNNVCETRDFAWLLSAWDRELLMGRTYVSGLLAWIPSFLMPVRSEMGWGRFSTYMTELDGAGHPGLRPTIFGEAYFNFGVLGVLVFGVLLGIVFGRISAFAQRTVELSDSRERAFRLLCAFLYFECFLRLQQSGNYFQCYIEVGLVVVGLVGATALARFRAGAAPGSGTQAAMLRSVLREA